MLQSQNKFCIMCTLSAHSTHESFSRNRELNLAPEPATSHKHGHLFNDHGLMFGDSFASIYFTESKAQVVPGDWSSRGWIKGADLCSSSPGWGHHNAENKMTRWKSCSWWDSYSKTENVNVNSNGSPVWFWNKQYFIPADTLWLCSKLVCICVYISRPTYYFSIFFPNLVSLANSCGSEAGLGCRSGRLAQLGSQVVSVTFSSIKLRNSSYMFLFFLLNSSF